MIVIVVTTWNHLETTTRPCLDSVRRFTDVPYRIVCVDNGSADDTPEFLSALADSDPRLTVALRERNLGWAGGTLEGLQLLRDDDKGIVLLNSDTVVTPGWLSRMTRVLDSHPDLTMVIPREIPEVDGPWCRLRRRLLGGSTSDATISADEARAMIPGTLDAPPPPPLDEILRVAARMERRYRGQSRPAPPSGFCALLHRRDVPDLVKYLGDFERYRSGDLDWRDLWTRVQGACHIALDTYVYHARGGSGGYYRYRGE